MTTASQAQIEANRRNAQHSTGPKTSEGKAASSMNALKHAVLARQILVHGHDIDESTDEFKDFCAEYHEHLAPVGPLEQMLVDQIVAINWRLRRARMAETAEITLSVDDAWRRHNNGINPDSQWLGWLASGDPVFNMQKTADGNHVIERMLGDLREMVEREGELTETAIQELVCGFGGKPNILTRRLDNLRLELLKNPEGLDLAALRERNLKTIFDYLDKEFDKLANRFADCLEDECNRAQTSQTAAVLPSEQTLQKILRYESTLEKQLFRAMDQLEHLQRRRLGQKPASTPPMETPTNA
jgi:hypothetical protein